MMNQPKVLLVFPTLESLTTRWADVDPTNVNNSTEKWTETDDGVRYYFKVFQNAADIAKLDKLQFDAIVHMRNNLKTRPKTMRLEKELLAYLKPLHERLISEGTLRRAFGLPVTNFLQ